ncbi:unnamed protein product [Amoebophrya sp. A120]|nr:unnamed protein product [Amoebophrya sp. A120]|eukprot:GSA120T00019338001.1
MGDFPGATLLTTCCYGALAASMWDSHLKSLFNELLAAPEHILAVLVLTTTAMVAWKTIFEREEIVTVGGGDLHADEVATAPSTPAAGDTTKNKPASKHPTRPTAKSSSSSYLNLVAGISQLYFNIFLLLPTYGLIVLATSSPERDSLLVTTIYALTFFGLVQQHFPVKMGLENLAAFACPAFSILPANIANFLGRTHGHENTAAKNDEKVLPEELGRKILEEKSAVFERVFNRSEVIGEEKLWREMVDLPPGSVSGMHQGGSTTTDGAIGQNQEHVIRDYMKKVAETGQFSAKDARKIQKDVDEYLQKAFLTSSNTDGMTTGKNASSNKQLPDADKDLATLLHSIPQLSVETRGPKIFGFTLYNLIYPFLLVDRRDRNSWLFIVYGLLLFNVLDRLYMWFFLTLFEQRSFRRQRFMHDVTIGVCWLYTLIGKVFLGELFATGGSGLTAVFIIWRAFYLGHLLLFVGEHVAPMIFFGLRPFVVKVARTAAPPARETETTQEENEKEKNTSTSAPALTFLQSGFGPRKQGFLSTADPDGTLERIQEVYMVKDWKGRAGIVALPSSSSLGTDESCDAETGTEFSTSSPSHTIAFHGTSVSTCWSILQNNKESGFFKPKLGQIGKVTYFASDIDAASCFSGEGWVFVCLLKADHESCSSSHVTGVTTANFTPRSEGRECPIYVCYDNSKVEIIGILRIRLYDGPWAPKIRGRKELTEEFLRFVAENQSGSLSPSETCDAEGEGEGSKENTKQTDEIYYTSPLDLQTARGKAKFRLGVWNIQFWHTVHGQLDIQKIINEIKLLDCNILVLNEAMLLWPYLTKQNFEKKMREDCGYEFFLYGNTTKWDWHMKLRGAFFGNVILSRRKMQFGGDIDTNGQELPNSPFILHMAGARNYRPHEDRSAVSTGFVKITEDLNLRVTGTHLEIWDLEGKVALEQAKQIVGRLDKGISKPAVSSSRTSSGTRTSDAEKKSTGTTSTATTLDILCGDLNALRVLENKEKCEYDADRLARFPKPFNSNVCEFLEKGDTGFRDCFDLCDLQPPKMTVWSTARVDYYYVRPVVVDSTSSNVDFENSFKQNWRPRVYRGAAVSDHLPMLLEYVGTT